MRSILAIALALVAGCRATGGAHPQALALANQGALYLNNGEAARAREAFKLCLEYSPDLDRCLNGLGMAAWQSGQLDEGADWFRRAIRANRDYAEARNNLGAYFLERQEYHRASELFRSALGVDPGYQDARYNLATSLLRSVKMGAARGDMARVAKQLTEAESQLIRLSELAPMRADTFALLAAVYLERAQHQPAGRTQDMERARVTFNQCLAANPQQVDCLALGARLAYQMADCDTAAQRIATLRGLGTGLEAMPELPKQVQACLAARDAEIANLQQRWETEAARGNTQPLLDLCAHFIARRVVDKAQAYCRTAMERAPKAAGLRSVYAAFLVQIQQPAEAEAVCEQVLRMADARGSGAAKECAEIVRTLRLASP